MKQVLQKSIKKIGFGGFLAAVAVVASVGLTTTPSYASTSGGSGGAYTWQTNKSFTAAGYTSTYHIDASGIDPTKPVGLVVDFHGDGAYGYKNPGSNYALGGVDGIRAVAREYNMITVSILTPDRATGDLTWWWRGNSYADYVQALLTQVYGQYNIDKQHVWLTGFSGGAQFITQYYLPEFAGSGLIEGGGALLFGGGDDPTGADPQAATVNPIPASFKQNFNMFWGSGTADGPDGTGWEGGYKSAQDGYTWYQNQGFTKLSTYYPSGWCHSTTSTCTSFEYKFGTYLRQQLQAAYPNGIPTSGGSTSDTTAPTVSLSASDTDFKIGDSVTLSSSASDNIGVTKVEFYRGTTKLGEDTTSPYSLAWNTTGITAGTHSLTAKAYDAAGNSKTSTAVSVTADDDTFSYNYNTNRYGVDMNVYAPTYVDVARLTVSPYPWTDSRSSTNYNYDYNYPDATGYVSLSLVNELQRNTKYYFKIEFDGKVVETGVMYTEV